MALPEPGRIRGVFLVHLGELLLKEHGPEALEKVAARLSPEAARALRAPANFDWYPMTDAVAIEQAVIDAFYGGDIAQAARFGRFDVHDSLKGIYRFLFRLLDTETLILKAGKVWSKYYDQGRLIAEKVGPRNVLLRVEGFNPVHPIHCHELTGAFYGAVDAARLKTGRVEHSECVLDGKQACLFEVRW